MSHAADATDATGATDAFEIQAKDGAGRVGTLHTSRRAITTPALLPVVHPDQRSVPVDLLEDLGVEAVIANSYSLLKSDRRQAAIDRGVHEILGFDGVVMTDSGTFQAHVYGDVDVTNEEILDFQARIGSDVATILDVFAEPDDGHDQLRDGVETTIRRAEAAIKLYDERDAGAGGTPGLALPIQGGTDLDLRRDAAARIDELPGLVYPIGGVVPLMEEQRVATLARVVAAAKQGLGVDKPVHLFGCGHPRVLPLAVLLGCDLFDSASYAKYANEGRYIVPEGTLHLDAMLGGDLPCACPVCVDHTPDELQARADERPSPLAEHNLRVLVAEIRRIRTAIRRGELFEFALRRARAHPRVADALRVLEDDRDRLLALDPETKPSAVTYVGPETRRRPEVVRYRRRLQTRLVEAWRRAAGTADAGPVVVEVPWTPEIAEGRAGPLLDPDRGLTAEVADELTAAGVFVVHQTPIGPVPRVLLGQFPAGQVVAPREVTPTETEELVHATRRLVDGLDPAKTWVWDGADVADQALAAATGEAPAPWSPVWPRPCLDAFDAGRRVGLARLAAGTIHQLGVDAAAALLGPDPADLEVETSRTGRIRSVRRDGEHLLARRARDGHVNLGPAGAHRLHDALEPPKLRVPVADDSVPYNRDGRSVFAGFVGDDGLDAGLPAAAECLVVDADDELVAYGPTRLSAAEMVAFERGVAVDVRGGLDG